MIRQERKIESEKISLKTGFAKKYPVSYACREGANGPLAQNISVQINNSDTESPIEYIKIFFNVAEQVRDVEVGVRDALLSQ